MEGGLGLGRGGPEFSIVLAAVIGILWSNESLTWHKAIAIFLILLGVAFVALGDELRWNPDNDGGFDFAGR